MYSVLENGRQLGGYGVGLMKERSTIQFLEFSNLIMLIWTFTGSVTDIGLNICG